MGGGGILSHPWVNLTQLAVCFFLTLLFLYAAKVINDRETGRSRGFGFVTLHSEEDVRKAINELHDTVMGVR